ncbi:MAG TPA: hypothetical protein VF695_11065 [Sphingomonas sp.]|jgi:hypothetical protein
MPTIERQIDALGGTHSPDEAEYGRGYDAALDLALPIAADADALVDELLEVITDVLDGRVPLDRWATDARLLVQRVTHRRKS